MCIIVAKNAGVKMPSTEIITNCFNGNPDGAGIMLAAKGKVYGFKGLMTLDAFQAKLKQLQKRFGPLDKLPVVMHFRIGTHGANIAANTHPFPVASSYKTLRKLEWVSQLGMAHNGIITATGHHPDVKKENVSDTMVFIRRVAAPLCERLDIFKNPVFFEALQIAADSKLCFLNGRGELRCLGDFTMSNGVYYSNSSYEPRSYRFNWGKYASFLVDEDDYDIPSYTQSKKVREYPKLSKPEMLELACEIADDYVLDILTEDYIVRVDGIEYTLDADTYAIDWSDMTLYHWEEDEYDWIPSCFQDVEIIPKKEADSNA